MIVVQLHGPIASLDHRAGEPRAELAAPSEVLVDRERNRAAVPGDPFGWLSGTGLLLHARARRFGLAVVADGYSEPAEPIPWVQTPDPIARKQAQIPRDLVSCLTCGRLCLVARGRGDNEPLGLVYPSFWIRASIRHHTGIALPESSARWPKRAGVPHQCFNLFGE